MDLSKYDGILIIDPNINEEFDDRVYNTGLPDYTWKGDSDLAPDYKLAGAYTFGKTIRANLENMGKGYYSKVTDLGAYVIATIGYNNILTGRSSEKTYLIVFGNKAGHIISASNKYRTINGPDQAISYIRSTATILRNQTNGKI